MSKLTLLFVIISIFAAGAADGVMPAVWAKPVIQADTGEKISLDLKDADISEVFKLLSLKSGQMIVPRANVTGRVSIFLNKVTFSEALNLILRAQDLACEKKGSIISVMTAAEYQETFGVKFNEQRQEKSLRLTYADPAVVAAVLGGLKSDIGEVTVDDQGVLILFDTPPNLKIMEEVITELDQPRRTVVFDINYARAADMKTALDGVITPEVGEIIVDEKNSKIFVSDLPDKLREIEEIVKAFDEEERQVFIESQILELTLTDEFERGVDWQKLFNAKNFSGLDFAGEFSRSPAEYQQISVGAVAEDSYNLALQYLQANSDIKILTQPAVTVVNNKEGKIHIGSREAYVVQTTSQGETTVTSENVEFIDVGLQIDVIPRISSDGFITMKIKPEASSVRATLTTSIDSEIPLVDTAEVSTVVKVKDGQMLMIAGLKQKRYSDTIAGVPVLSKIPLLAFFFGRREVSLPQVSEFIVFLTPKIIRGVPEREGRDVEIAKLEAEILKRKTSGDRRPASGPVELRYETCPLNLRYETEPVPLRQDTRIPDFDKIFLPDNPVLGRETEDIDSVLEAEKTGEEKAPDRVRHTEE